MPKRYFSPTPSPWASNTPVDRARWLHNSMKRIFALDLNPEMDEYLRRVANELEYNIRMHNYPPTLDTTRG